MQRGLRQKARIDLVRALGTAGLPYESLEFPDRKPRLPPVNHAVTISANEREVVDMCSVPLSKRCDRFIVMALDETLSALPIVKREVEAARLTQ